MAACLIILRNYEAAIMHCNCVLKVDSKNQKALFRKTQGLIGEKKLSEAQNYYSLFEDVTENKNSSGFLKLKKDLIE